MYPPRKKFPLRLKDLAAFCFPGGVKVGTLKFLFPLIIC